ncbi:MAG: hypothetical protein AAF447_03115 [Myxococcota bacterium]
MRWATRSVSFALLALGFGCGETLGGDDCRSYCEALDPCLPEAATMQPTSNLDVCLSRCEDLFANVFEDDACGRAPGSYVSCVANVAETGTCIDILRVNRAPPAEGEERPCLDQARRLGPCGLSVPASF